MDDFAIAGNSHPDAVDHDDMHDRIGDGGHGHTGSGSSSYDRSSSSSSSSRSSSSSSPIRSFGGSSSSRSLSSPESSKRPMSGIGSPYLKIKPESNPSAHARQKPDQKQDSPVATVAKSKRVTATFNKMMNG